MFHDAALDLEGRGDLRGAALRWEKVVELQPDWVEGWCRYGDALAALGRTPEAHRAWRQGAFHPDCAESQGLAWLEEHPSWALQRFQTLAKVSGEDPRTDLLLARAQSRLVGPDASRSLRRYLERVRDEQRSDALLRTTTEEVVGSLPTDDALVLLDQVVGRFPDLSERFAETLLELQVEVRTRELMGAAPSRLTPEQRERVDAARSRAEHGGLQEAREALEHLADEVSRSPVVWAALADIRESQGDIGGALTAIELARQLDPSNAAYHARVSDLLADHYAMRFDDEALAALGRALDVGEEPALLERHARLALRAGRPEAARRSLDRLAALGREDVAAPLLADLDRIRPAMPVLPPVPPPAGVDPEAWRRVHRARVFLERARSLDGVWDADLLARAEDSADEALEASPDLPLALELRARLHVVRGHPELAVPLYQRILEAEPEDAEVLGQLAELLQRLGSGEAESVLQRAADAGSAYGLVALARRDVRDHRYLAARERLQRYLRVTSRSPWHAEALRLQAEVDRALRLAGLAAVGVVVVLFGGPLWLAWRRRRGVGLLRFVQRHPRSLPEVARLLSAIRHEVVKHNVSTVPALAERVAAGEDVPLDWVEQRLCGPDGALARFRAYTAELEALGRRAGIPLNLRHRDPVFRDGIRAMDGLQAACRRLGPGSVTALVRHASVVNGPFYEQLGHLLDGVSVVRLDEALLRAAWKTVCSEQPETRIQLAIEGPEASVRIPRADLHDILVNLLRNALAASLEEGRERLGIRLAVDEDFVTGLLRAEIRVCDDVQKRLTTKMIRGRYIDRGLGLAVDLTSRAGGSIHVESEPGWTKAVVVRLPMEEGR